MHGICSYISWWCKHSKYCISSHGKISTQGIMQINAWHLFIYLLVMQAWHNHSISVYSINSYISPPLSSTKSMVDVIPREQYKQVIKHIKEGMIRRLLWILLPLFSFIILCAWRREAICDSSYLWVHFESRYVFETAFCK